MSRNIDAVFVDFFDSEVKRAYGDYRVLGETVYTKSNVEGKTAYFNKKAKGLATRHNPGSDVTAMNTDFSRVSCNLEDWEAFDYADKFDAKKINFTEITELSEVAGDAIGLRMDQIIIDAIDTAAATSGTGFVGVDSAALTVATLLEAKKTLDNAGVPATERFFAHTPTQIEDLLNTTQVTSSDYNTVKTLVNGEVNTFLGFNLKMVAANRLEGGLPTGTSPSDYNDGFIYHKRSVGQAIGMNMETEMSWIPEKRAYLVGAEFSSGAVAIDSEGIVRVRSTI